MAESQNTFFLVNVGAQSGQGVNPVQGRAGQIVPAGNHEPGSGAAFSRVLQSQIGQDGHTSQGLQKALQELSRILEVVSSTGPPGVVLASTMLVSRQSLPVTGKILPEQALQQMQQLLDTISESGLVIPAQARLHLQQLLDRSSESGLVIPAQARQRLQQLLERLEGSGSGQPAGQVVAVPKVQQEVPQILPEQVHGLSTEAGLGLKVLPEKAHQRLQQLLDVSEESNRALPEMARLRIQQLLDGSSEIDLDLPGDANSALTEQALQQLQQFLDGAVNPGSDLPEGLPENASKHLQKLLEIADEAKAVSLFNPLTEAIRNIVQELRAAVPAGKTGDAATSVAVATGDVMKSLRLVNPDADARNGSVSARMLALHGARPMSSVMADNTGVASTLDKETGLSARTGLDQQGQPASRLPAINLATDKIIEQVSIKGSSLNTSQATGTQNVQPVEVRDFSSMLLPALNVSTKADMNSTLFAPQARLEMQQPLQHSEWGRELGSRVVWMTRQQVQTANIRINQPHLGPIEIRVAVQNDTANVSFISQHVAVRDVIESSIPRLREMLGENGINLENVDVADYSSAREQQRRAHAEDDFLSSSGNASAQASDEIESGLSGDIITASVSQQGAGLIDYYA